MVLSVPVPSSRVNCNSFFDFGTATQALTFTARKSDLENVSKSTNSSNKGSTFTLEKSIFSDSVFTFFSGLQNHLPSFFFVFTILRVSLSGTGARPPDGVGAAEHHGAAVYAYAQAARGRHAVLESGERSPRPSCRPRFVAVGALSAWALKRWRWSMGSLSSEKALPISQPQMNISHTAPSAGGILGLRLARGLTSTGYMVILKVGWMRSPPPSGRRSRTGRCPQVGLSPVHIHADALGQLHGGVVVALMAMKSAPVTFLTASAMVMRFQLGARSMSLAHATGYGRCPTDLLLGAGGGMPSRISIMPSRFVNA